MNVVCEMSDGTKRVIETKFLNPESQRRFYELIAQHWGPDLAPKPRIPGILSTRIRIPWYATKTKHDEQTITIK